MKPRTEVAETPKLVHGALAISSIDLSQAVAFAEIGVHSRLTLGVGGLEACELIQHGLLLRFRALDGTRTLHLIPWAAVAKVNFRP